MNAATILRPDAPTLQLHTASDADMFDQAQALNRESPRHLVARAVRGRKCATSTGFFSEVGAAWQLPPHFGDNWDALVDCLSDLRWCLAGAYIMVVQQAMDLLQHESIDQFKTFTQAMDLVAQRLARGVPDRPPATFRVILHAEPRDESRLKARLQAALERPEPKKA